MKMTTINFTFCDNDIPEDFRGWRGMERLTTIIDERGNEGLFADLSPALSFSHSEVSEDGDEFDVVFVADLTDCRVILDAAKAKSLLQEAFKSI